MENRRRKKKRKKKMGLRSVIMFFLDFFMESFCGGDGEFYSTRKRWVYFSVCCSFLLRKKETDMEGGKMAILVEA